MDFKIVALLFTAIGHHVLSVDDSTPCCSSRPSECCQYRTSDCLDLRDSGETRSGVYRIIPPDMHTGYEVYCDMETDGGGWMVFQRREDGSEDFYRHWDDYEAGFGNVSHEHWLGDAMKYHNRGKFSTYDRNAKDCAKSHYGAWWYKECAEANLNGHYYSYNNDNKKVIKYRTYWRNWPQDKPDKYYPIKRTEMKLRRT